MRRLCTLALFCFLYSCGSFFGIIESEDPTHLLVGKWDNYKISNPLKETPELMPQMEFTQDYLIIKNDSTLYELSDDFLQLNISGKDSSKPQFHIEKITNNTLILKLKSICPGTITIYFSKR